MIPLQLPVLSPIGSVYMSYSLLEGAFTRTSTVETSMHISRLHFDPLDSSFSPGKWRVRRNVDLSAHRYGSSKTSPSGSSNNRSDLSFVYAWDISLAPMIWLIFHFLDIFFVLKNVQWWVGPYPKKKNDESVISISWSMAQQNYCITRFVPKLLA